MEQGVTVKSVVKKGKFRGFIVSGHANTAPHGQDVVCAAISMLTQVAVEGVKMRVPCSFGVSPGLTYLNLHDEDADKEQAFAVQVLIENMFRGLQMVDTAHPGIISWEEQVIST